MDEPTNDLDMDTLELLEELLAEFPRYGVFGEPRSRILDNVVTQSWVFLGEGNILEFSGGYSDWFGYKDRYFC